MKTIKRSVLLILLLGLLACTSEKENETIVPRVLIIGVDGLSADGVKNANTPTLDSLINNGASTLSSRSMIPTSSGPNWASILMGASPERHGVTNNSYNPSEPALPPMVSGNGKNGIFPTVFEVIHTKHPEWETGAIYNWGTIKNFYEKEHVDYFENPKTDEEVLEATQKYIKAKKPNFCFIHFDNVDQVGHSYGHGSQAYYKEVEKIDALVGKLTQTLKAEKLADKTMIILLADHGGFGFGHNDNVPEVLKVPFIVSGPNIKQGYNIMEPVSIIDTSPTALYFLGLEIPSVWTGKPIKSAFVGEKEPDTTYIEREFYRQPRFTPMQDAYIPAGGLFIDKKPNLVIDTKSDKETTIYYTLNGEDPGTNSKKYTETDSLKFDQTAVVKAAKFKNGKRVSNINTAFYRVVEKEQNLGVIASIYYGKHLEKLPDFDKMSPVIKSYPMYEFTSRGLKYPKGADQVAVKFTSYLKVETAGEYTFYTESDDGSKLFVNDKEIVDSDGNHGVRPEEGKIFLKEGKHKINVLWYNSGGGLWLQTYVKGPNTPRQVLTTQMPSSGLSLHKN